jgi:hypothetical protein
MDWGPVFSGLAETIPEGSVLGAILLFVLYREIITRGDRKAWKEDRAELKGELTDAKAENADLERRLDEERGRRRAVEDGKPWDPPTTPLPAIER